MTVDRAFVIADLAGYTAAVDAHGDVTASELAAALEEAASASLEPGDELVKSMGDAVLVACTSEESALQFLRALFDRFDSDERLPLLRAGAHFGSAVRRDDDYFGSGVNIAARVTDLAAGCQILATESMADAARARDIGVVALGDFELRNISEPVGLFEIACGHDVRGHTVDPVCHMRVARDDAPAHLRYNDTEYWFCSLDCVARFASQPETFVG